MSTDLSSATIAAMCAQETGRLVLEILTIDHDGLDTPFRLVNNKENISVSGTEYEAVGFEAYPPKESDDGFGTGRLVVSNVERWLTPSIRSLAGPFSVTLALVSETDLGADPPELDTVERSWLPMELKNLRYNRTTVSGDLAYDSPLRRQFPAMRFDPKNFAGLFS